MRLHKPTQSHIKRLRRNPDLWASIRRSSASRLLIHSLYVGAGGLDASDRTPSLSSASFRGVHARSALRTESASTTVDGVAFALEQVGQPYGEVGDRGGSPAGSRCGDRARSVLGAGETGSCQDAHQPFSYSSSTTSASGRSPPSACSVCHRPSAS
jgi:hypothetical protein